MIKGKNIKRILAVLMMALMMVSFMPTMGVFADEAATTTAVPGETGTETTGGELTGAEDPSTPPADTENGAEEGAPADGATQGEEAEGTAQEGEGTEETAQEGAESAEPAKEGEEPAPAPAEPKAIKVYVTISVDGEAAEGRNGEKVAVVPVELLGKATYNFDDVFKNAHEQYHPDGESAYGTAATDWGTSLSKLWGIENGGNYGYQVNGGVQMAMGLTDPINDGDFVDGMVYKNAYPNTEAYAKFDKKLVIAEVGEEIALVLTAGTEYDENWNYVFTPVKDAVISVDGVKAEVTTDAEGKMTICFDKDTDAGEHVISATLTKELDGAVVPAITSAVARVIIKAKEATTPEEPVVEPTEPAEQEEPKEETPAPTGETKEEDKTAAPTSQPSGQGATPAAAPAASGVPKTGDAENMMLYAFILGASMVAVLAAKKAYRK